ncbi:NUDIX domain-containing protein [Burkholderia sp. R-70006]|uniref:NUDIX hydrolase n=1 Tax=Paraburkholderia domus TaxID=2793075 RepID=UPI001913A75E|nr:NUDIX domain-containing protein [Paraburkholderia domus]MBK5053824.1 NUDIX domain-containing protein [Burkholderia sp. R-70006]
MKERATIVCRQHDKILLVTRGRSRWSLPGGTIRRSESPIEAAGRELTEETALAVDGFTFLFEFGGLTKRHHVFLVDLPDHLTPSASNEILRCRWIRPRHVSTVITSVPTREIVRLLISHKNVTIALPAIDLGTVTAAAQQPAV